MEIQEAIKILGLSENPEEAKVENAYFKQQQNIQAGFTAIDKSTGKDISPEVLNEAYSVVKRLFRLRSAETPVKSKKIKLFFELYWFRIAVITVIGIAVVVVGFAVVKNIFNGNKTYNIVMMGQEYLSLVDKTGMTNSIGSNVPGFDNYYVTVYSKDDFSATQSSDIGGGEGGGGGGAPANVMSKIFAQLSNGEIDMLILDKSLFTSMSVSNALDNMQPHLDAWGITAFPDTDKRYARPQAGGAEQFYGIDLSKYPMFNWTSSDVVQFIVCVPVNSTKTDRTEMLIKAMIINNG